MVDGGQEKLCASYSCETGDQVTLYFNGGSAIGDTIKVKLPGLQKVLSICEIIAYGNKIT